MSAVVGGGGDGAVPKPLVRSPRGLCTVLILQGPWHLPSAGRGVAVARAHMLPRISLHGYGFQSAPVNHARALSSVSLEWATGRALVA